jgi:hypothetical protein
MSPPSGNTLSERARELLRAERTASEPEALKRRALERARTAFEAERVSRIHASSAPVMLSRRPSVRVGLAMAAALMVAGVAAAGVRWWPATGVPHAPRLASPSVRTYPQPRVNARDAERQAPDATSAPVEPAGREATTARRAAPAPAPELAKPPIARQYALELAVLEPARRAVAGGDFAGALAAVSQHQREFPGGLLTEERSALRVRALWGLGRTAEAESAAAAFRQRYPRSALLAWMRQK